MDQSSVLENCYTPIEKQSILIFFLNASIPYVPHGALIHCLLFFACLCSLYIYHTHKKHNTFFIQTRLNPVTSQLNLVLQSCCLIVMGHQHLVIQWFPMGTLVWLEAINELICSISSLHALLQKLPSSGVSFSTDNSWEGNANAIVVLQSQKAIRKQTTLLREIWPNPQERI